MYSRAMTIVFLSAAIPLASRDPRYLPTADEPRILAAVAAATTYAVSRPGGVLRFGGHPSVLDAVFDAAAKAGGLDRVQLFLSSYFRTPDSTHRYARFTNGVTWVDPPATHAESRDHALDAIRRAMLAAPPDLAVFAGGMEGVEAEFDLCQRLYPAVPCVPLPTTGGAARIVFDLWRSAAAAELVAAVAHQIDYAALIPELVALHGDPRSPSPRARVPEADEVFTELMNLRETELLRELRAPTGAGQGEVDRLIAEHPTHDAARVALRLRARAAPAVSRGAGARVLIVPGIMGSTLGIPAQTALRDDVIWLDPVDIIGGRFGELSLDEGAPSRIAALELLPLVYTPLRLRLEACGFEVESHPFDWRRSLARTGDELAGRLRDALRGDPTRPLHVVCHSMGCMLLRAAFSRLDVDLRRRLGRVVFLAPPNLGSVEALRALQGRHALVGALRQLLRFSDSADQLLPTIQSFDGLYELVPERFLQDGALVPDGLPPERVKSARDRAGDVVRGLRLAPLAALGDRLVVIAGHGLPTPGLDADGRPETVDGDGVVPHEWTDWSAALTHYDIRWEHSSMPGAPAVLEDIPALLRGEALPRALEVSRSRAADVDVLALREAPPVIVPSDPYAIVRGFVRPAPEGGAADEGAAVAASELPPLVPEPPPVEAVPYATQLTATEWGVTVQRSTGRRLSLRCVGGPFTASRADVGVLLHPLGGALPPSLYELDRQLDHLLQATLLGRPLAGRAGEQNVLPTEAFRAATRLVLLVGVGPTSTLAGTLESTLLATFEQLRCWRVREVGIQLPVALDPSSPNVARALLRSVYAAGARSSAGAPLAISLCTETARDAHALHGALLAQLAGELPRGLTVEMLDPVAVDPVAPASSVEDPGVAPVFLAVHESLERASGNLSFRYDLFGESVGGSAMSGAVSLPLRDLEALRRTLRSDGITTAPMLAFGKQLALQLLPEPLRVAIAGQRAPLVVLQGRDTTRVPWEPLAFGDFCPALEYGLSRLVRFDDVHAAPPPAHRVDDRLRVIAVIDPERNLPNARREGEYLEALARRSPELHIEFLRHEEATLAAISRRMESGEFDVMHFAGHGSFDVTNRPASGLRCADGTLLNSAAIARLARTPPLLVFNACESARVRGADDAAHAQMSLAEACLFLGVRGYVGTYWPVGDAAACAFAGAFYERLVAGSAISTALVSGRRAVQSQPSRAQDWADYLHYGHPGLSFRRGKSRSAGAERFVSVGAVPAPDVPVAPAEDFPYSISVFMPFVLDDTTGVLSLADHSDWPVTFVNGVAEGSAPSQPTHVRLGPLAPVGSALSGPGATRRGGDPTRSSDETRAVELDEMFAKPGVALPANGRLIVIPRWGVACHEEHHPPAKSESRFNSWEHIWCGRFVGWRTMPEEGMEHLAADVFTQPVSITNRTKLLLESAGFEGVDFGEIICLAGDYYAHFDPDCATRFADAWPAARASIPGRDYREQTLWGEEPAVIKDILDSIHRGAARGPRLGGEYVQLIVESVGGRYPVGRYLTLAAYNTCHFGSPDDGWPQGPRSIANEALRMYDRYHTLALERARGVRDSAAFLRAVATEAFACHFLTDLFASGHMRTPRRALAERYGVFEGGLLMSKKMHDEDNEHGLWVRTRHEKASERLVWRAYGDGELLEDKAEVHLRMVQTAVQRSVAEVFDSAMDRKTGPALIARLLVPIALAPDEDPVGAGLYPPDVKHQRWSETAKASTLRRNHAPLYRVNSDGKVEKRKGNVEGREFELVDEIRAAVPKVHMAMEG